MDYETDRAVIRSLPNKLKILRWVVDKNTVYPWTFSNKRLFALNSWYQKDSGTPDNNTFDRMPFITHKPSIKERSWFRGFLMQVLFLFVKSGVS